MPTVAKPTEPIRASATMATSTTAALALLAGRMLERYGVQMDMQDLLLLVGLATSLVHWVAGEWARGRVTAPRVHIEEAE